jgi:hypothetical protein
MLRFGKPNPEGATTAREELVGDLDQEPRAIPRIIFAPTGPSVIQIEQRRDSIPDQLMRPASLQVNDEADSAAIVFPARVIEPLG